jgi:glycosyltransferase involved in cell wall biosynthesis
MTASPAATVLVPTHEHPRLFAYALHSIQMQSFRDFEVLVVGDGAPPATRETVEQFARSDPRIRYFAFPKGERNGELHRHAVLQDARGRVVAYCGDDDLWFPDHLLSLWRLLKLADFGNSLQIEVYLEDRLNIRLGNLARARTRDRIGGHGVSHFGLSEAAHRMALYRRMAVGWSPSPPAMASDQHMFRKILDQPGIRCASTGDVSAIHFPSPLRRTWSEEEREAELRLYAGRMAERGLRREFRAAIRQKRATDMRLADRLREQAGVILRRLASGFFPPP